MSVIRSTDSLLTAAADYGLWSRLYIDKSAAGTAANSTSGYTSGLRMPNPITFPSLGAGTKRAFLPYIHMVSSLAGTGIIVALEYLLGTIDMNAGTFTDGVPMPYKVINNQSIQTAASVVMMVVTSAVTATTPVVTITYKNQAGTGGQSAALTLPTNAAANSSFQVQPHFASGDTGIIDITNITKSAGSAGTIKVYGLLVLGTSSNALAGFVGSVDPLVVPHVMYPAEASNVIAFYQTGSAAAADIFGVLSAVSD